MAGTVPADGKYTRVLKWSHKGHEFATKLSFNFADYYYYKNLPKRNAGSAYSGEFASHPYLIDLAKALDKDAQAMGYKDYALAEYLVAFVQEAIPYTKDPENNGYDYPKYPIETLTEQGGDCEDKSALLVALLNTFGFDAVLLGLPSHMAVAVACDDCGSYYEYNGKKYSYIETTMSGWEIGSVPPEYKKASALIIKGKPVTAYTRETQTADGVKTQVAATTKTPTRPKAAAPETSSITVYKIVVNNGVITVISYRK